MLLILRYPCCPVLTGKKEREKDFTGQFLVIYQYEHKLAVHQKPFSDPIWLPALSSPVNGNGVTDKFRT